MRPENPEKPPQQHPNQTKRQLLWSLLITAVAITSVDLAFEKLHIIEWITGKSEAETETPSYVEKIREMDEALGRKVQHIQPLRLATAYFDFVWNGISPSETGPTSARWLRNPPDAAATHKEPEPSDPNDLSRFYTDGKSASESNPFPPGER